MRKRVRVWGVAAFMLTATVAVVCAEPGLRRVSGSMAGPDLQEPGRGTLGARVTEAGVAAGGLTTGAARAGIGSQMVHVPFRAVQVIVRRGPEGVVETRGQMARNSAGSTYVELIDERTKLPVEVLIFDVPHHRKLVLDVGSRRYRVLPVPGLQGREMPVDFLAEQVRVATMEKGSSVREVRDGVELTWKGLGVQRVGGLEAVGSVRVRRPLAAPGEAADGPAEVDESWLSVDLGIAVLRMRHDPLKDEDTEVALTEVLRAEPDARLFEVPKGFVEVGGDGLPGGAQR